MTAKQFQAWAHFAEIEPFTFDTELREDYRTASILQMLANLQRGKRKPYTLDDFRIKFNETPKRQTWQEQKMMAIMIATMHNASVTN